MNTILELLFAQTLKILQVECSYSHVVRHFFVEVVPKVPNRICNQHGLFNAHNFKETELGKDHKGWGANHRADWAPQFKCHTWGSCVCTCHSLHRRLQILCRTVCEEKPICAFYSYELCRDGEVCMSPLSLIFARIH